MDTTSNFAINCYCIPEVESKAWMYPAYLDIFTAVIYLPLIIALIKKRILN